MKIPAYALLLVAVVACKAPQFTQAGQRADVSVSYRWNHPPGKPGELLLKIINNGDSARQVHLGIDLSYQAFTVEQFTADTCIPAGRTYNGKLNGIYFISRKLDAAQTASPDCRVELSEFSVEPRAVCP